MVFLVETSTVPIYSLNLFNKSKLGITTFYTGWVEKLVYFMLNIFYSS